MRSRRDFLAAVAGAGGSAAGAMLALDLLQPMQATAFGLEGSGNGTKIVILGAGVAGLCAAYELGKHGYDCTVLEARARPGGRVWTARDGTRHTELDGTTQTAAFPEGQYFNPGPGRVPQHHVTMEYYREFGIELEQFGNVNMNAYYHSASAPHGSTRIRMREAKMPLAGYAAEALAKSAADDALDVPLGKDDKAKLLAFLADSAGLDEKHRYVNDGAAGYRTMPGAAAQAGVPSDPLGFLPLVRGGYGAFIKAERELDQQTIMFQPVGGIDALPHAFAAKLGTRIRYESTVTAIRKTPAGVRIAYTDAHGAAHVAEGAYCICAIPLSVVRTIPNDFSHAFAASIARVAYAPSVKIGLAFKRRFWEEDDRIMSGISRTDQSIVQIWYPSYGYLGRNGGILTGAYTYGKGAARIGALTPHARAELALREGAAIHPQYPAEFASAFSVAWQNTPHNRGAWAMWTKDTRAHDYPRLNEPDVRIYLAGEHMSYITGWQAGALESARSVAARLHARVRRNVA